MPTIVRPVEQRRVLIEVTASADGTDPEGHRYAALVDTGAQRSAVTSQVAASVGARRSGSGYFRPASGQLQPADLVELRLWIPIEYKPRGTFVAGGELAVFELPYQPSDFDVILGMDTLVRFHITMQGGNFILSN